MQLAQTALHSGGATLEKVSVSDARDSLPKLIDRVTSLPFCSVELDKWNQPQALLISLAAGRILDAVYNVDVPEVLRNLCINRWLGILAPDHLKRPQQRELEALSPHQLMTLLVTDADKLFAEGAEVPGIDADVVDRLRKRRHLAVEIAKSQAEGLYEANEHLTQL
jgi:hypothetical protein